MTPLVLDIETAPTARALALPYPEDRQAPGNYKKEEAIAAWHERDRVEWAAGLAKTAALNPRLGRVVAVGGPSGVTVGLEEADEASLVERAFFAIAATDRLVTFNGLGFDLPYLHVRAAILGVRIPYKPSDYLRRYATRPHADLYAILSNWSYGEKGDTLTGWCEAFGIPVTDQTTGAEVGEAVRRGDAEFIRTHCAADVDLTAALYERLQAVGWL